MGRQSDATTLQDVAARVRLALDMTEETIEILHAAAETATEAATLAGTALAGSAHYPPELALARFDQARALLADLIQGWQQAENSVAAILDRLGGGQDTPAARADRGAPATWRGKTAAEHVGDSGAAIGRAGGRLRTRPVREVRSPSELDDLLTTLSRGGQVLDAPAYDGTIRELPDGTLIGHRRRAASAACPIVDVFTPHRRLKIHVRPEGWGQHVR
ncbi:hypothetical protein [Goodfellowiella coeruleoviolacea]|uniref:Uncharacterized protein n=1 Tax=Goodfellowiella coeruleoviolacea TaxID=334858 RepID=A0AAE3GKF8_9PSEU|nr:hypothetical protein [Goodfellowiella coeruleoviolacea]MCP2169907.1 hypothetical protein [Goodfellowiella coeruleoviolacea]